MVGVARWTKSTKEFGAGVGGEDFVEPGLLGGLVLASEDFNYVAVFEFFVEVTHFAIDFDADDVVADFGVKTISEIKREGALREVDDVTFWSINEYFVGEEVELEFLEVDLLPFTELCGGHLELGDPEKISGEMLDLPFLIILSEFLFIVIEAGGKATIGVFVHFFGTDLKFDDAFVFSDNCSMERLIAILFWHSNIILNAAAHRSIE